MDDVFISYAGEDRDKAEVIATVLESKGWSVWWDREIPPGRSYDEVIEQALSGARAVFVLWSAASVASRWVRAEASVAAERGILVPVFLEGVAPPLEFRHVQAVDLSAWEGEPDDAALQAMFDAVARLVDTARSSPPAPLSRSSPRRLSWQHVAAIVAVSLVTGAGVMYLAREGRSTTPSASPQAPSSTTANAPPSRRAGSGRIDVLAASNGGHLVQAPHENWTQPIDGSENWQYLTGGEAIYAFDRDQEAAFDTFRMLITETRSWNIKQFELLAGSGTPAGPFRSLGVFETQNVRLFPSPWQDFPFAPTVAKYLKVRVISLWQSPGATQVEQWQLLGELR